MLTLSGLELLSQNTAVLEQNYDSGDDDTTKVNVLLRLGENFCSRENKKALFYLEKSLELSEKLGYQRGVANSYLWLGRVYYYMDEYENAELCLSKAKILFEDESDFDGLAFYYFAVGSINNLKGDHVNAIKNYQKVIELSKITRNDHLWSAGLMSLGTIYIDRNDPDKAITYLKESLALKKTESDLGGVANILTSMGKVFEYKNLLDSAMHYYQIGLDFRTQIADIRSLANSEICIGNLQIKLGNYVAAVESLRQAETYYTKLDDYTGICISKMSLAPALNYAGENQLANQTIGDALTLATKLSNPSIISNCYQIKSDLEFQQGNYLLAYQLVLKHKKINDSLTQVNKDEIIQELETQYQVQQKNNQIEILKSQGDIQKKNILILTISIIGLSLLAILIFILFRMKSADHLHQTKLLEQEKIIRQQEVKIAENEKLLLQQQVEAQNRDLATKALEVLRMNETIGKIINQLDSINKRCNKQLGISDNIREIVVELDHQSRSNTWKEFDKVFKNIHNDFYEKLLSKCPDLTAAEIKIAALLRLNLSTKEIAAITYKSEEGIKSTRYRLRKKLGLSSEGNLVAFLMQL